MFGYKKREEYFLIGDLAVILGIISFIPILIKMWKTKDTSNFTIINLLLAISSNILWIIYGIYTKSSVNLISGSLYLFIYLFITSIKYCV